MSRLPTIRAMIIDMDGVLWRGQTILPGVPDLFKEMRSRHVRYVLATNNASETPTSYRNKLKACGVEVAEENILTSALATASYLTDSLTGGKLLVIGDDGLRSALAQAGFDLGHRAEEASAVVVGMDRSVCWDQLAEATLAIRNGAVFVGTNPDPSFPTERGQVPGNGAVLAALQAASGIAPTVIGKPEPHLYAQATKILGVDPAETLILGDRLSTDILGGIRLGAPTALMLTGVTSEVDLETSDIQPDFVFEDLHDLLRIWEDR